MKCTSRLSRSSFETRIGAPAALEASRAAPSWGRSDRVSETRLPDSTSENQTAMAIPSLAANASIAPKPCSQNPKWGYLRMAPGARDTSPVNKDYVVPGLKTLLGAPDIALSRLVWRTLVALPNFSEK